MLAARSGSTDAAYESSAYPGIRRKPTDRIGCSTAAMTQIVHSTPQYGKRCGATHLRWEAHALLRPQPHSPGVQGPSRLDTRLARCPAETLVRRDRHRRRRPRPRDGVLPGEEPWRPQRGAAGE